MIPTTLTIIERQILSNQFKILSKIAEMSEEGEYEAQEYLRKSEIAENGYSGEYHEVFDVDSDEIPFEICEETSKILNMFRRINNAISELNDDEKAELNLKKISFEGFDGNNDPHYHYMSYIVNHLEKWGEYKDSYLNSHSSFTIQKYRKMLATHDRLLKGKYDLNKGDLIEIINSI